MISETPPSPKSSLGSLHLNKALGGLDGVPGLEVSETLAGRRDLTEGNHSWCFALIKQARGLELGRGHLSL